VNRKNILKSVVYTLKVYTIKKATIWFLHM